MRSKNEITLMCPIDKEEVTGIICNGRRHSCLQYISEGKEPFHPKCLHCKLELLPLEKECFNFCTVCGAPLEDYPHQMKKCNKCINLQEKRRRTRRKLKLNSKRH